MRILVITIVCLAVVGIAKAYAAGNLPFSLEYCQPTPVPMNPKGQTPGALTAKYTPEITKDLKLYVGTGLAYSLPSKEESLLRDHETGLQTGVAGQAGIKYELGDRASINLDYKYLHLGQTTDRSGNEASPQLFGLKLNCAF